MLLRGNCGVLMAKSMESKRMVTLEQMLADRLNGNKRVTMVRQGDGSMDLFKDGDLAVRVTRAFWLRFYVGRHVDEKGWVSATDRTADRIYRYVR